MQKIALRMPLFICVAVWFVLHANQVSAGEVYPIAVIESLWGPRADGHQYDAVPNKRAEIPEECKKETASTRVNNDVDIQWFEDCIVNVYGFKKNDTFDHWDKQGDFTGELEKPSFNIAAERVKAFFKDKENKQWVKTKKTYKTTDVNGNVECKKLLYITAARYLLVTYILFQQNENLKPCEEKSEGNKEITIPDSVCYPQPYGSATCTSDYDVGLVGKDAGILTKKFNQYFEINFGIPSENVFDTNVYAFTLEYAIPKKFTGLPPAFLASLSKAEEKVKFKMQELANAYFKVFKYEDGEPFSETLINSARSRLELIASVVKPLKDWVKHIDDMHNAVPLTGDRKSHNLWYQKLVKSISESGGYVNAEINLETLGNALLYAAEAYHTRGAIRFVVGSLQYKIPVYHPNQLSNIDLWVSMIENWGESIKEYNHYCKGKPEITVQICVLKMSKYMWRMISAMKYLNERIEAYKRKLPKAPSIGIPLPMGLVSFKKLSHPELVMRNWYENFKKTEKEQIKVDKQLDLSAFFQKFNCAGVVLGKPLRFDCIKAMNTRIDEYNQWLAEIFLKNHLEKPPASGK